MSEPSTQMTSPKPHVSRNIVIVVVVALVVCVAAYVAVVSPGFLLARSNNITVGHYATEMPITHLFTPVNGTITVTAGGYENYQVNVPSEAFNIQLSGTFTVTGGSGNDIDVYILNYTNFLNWQNGGTYSTYYNSGQVTGANFSVSLPAGQIYYLVYSNPSVVSTKTVNAHALFYYTVIVQVTVTYTSTT